MAFALILNVNATSATTTNGTNVNPSVNINLSSKMTNSANTVSANSSKSSTNLNIQISTTTKAVLTTADITKPKIISSDPINNALKVHTNKNIKITFSEAIKSGTSWIELKNNKGMFIPVKSSINGNLINIDPINYLIRGMKYTVIVHKGSFTDMTCNKVGLYVTKFTTVPVLPARKTVSAAFLKYLKPTANCQSNNPAIKSLASSITAGSTSGYVKAAKIFNWVKIHISYSFYYNTRYGALGTLKSRSANCVDTAHLVVALERAAGIPTRYNHGKCRFSSGTWYGHVWAQVYVNGKWYYADGTSYRNSLGVIKNWNTSTFTLKGVYETLPF